MDTVPNWNGTVTTASTSRLQSAASNAADDRTSFSGRVNAKATSSRVSFGSGEVTVTMMGELQYGFMFHSFDYPDETGENRLAAASGGRSWSMGYCPFRGLITIPREHKKQIRAMMPKAFGIEQNLQYVEAEAEQYASIVGDID